MPRLRIIVGDVDLIWVERRYEVGVGLLQLVGGQRANVCASSSSESSPSIRKDVGECSASYASSSYSA